LGGVSEPNGTDEGLKGKKTTRRIFYSGWRPSGGAGYYGDHGTGGGTLPKITPNSGKQNEHAVVSEGAPLGVTRKPGGRDEPVS